jgi:hypothetical protein
MMDIAPALIVGAWVLALVLIAVGLIRTIFLYLFLGWWRNHTG